MFIATFRERFSESPARLRLPPTTWATDIPGPVSSRVARPSGNAITASLGDDQIHWTHRRDRQRAFLHDFRSALGGVLHRHDDALGAGHQVHGAAHARHHFAGDHPVGELSSLIDLQAAKYRKVEMAAANEPERHCAIKCAGPGQGCDRTAARVGQAWDAPCLPQGGAPVPIRPFSD